MDVLGLISKSNEKEITSLKEDYTPIEDVIRVLTEYSDGLNEFSVNSSLFTYNHYYKLLILFSDIKCIGSKETILDYLLRGDTSFSIDPKDLVDIAKVFKLEKLTVNEYSQILALWYRATNAYFVLIGNLKVVKKSDFDGESLVLATKNELKQYDDKYSYKFYAPKIQIGDLEVSLMRIRALLLENGDTYSRLNSRDFIMTIYNYCKLREN